MGVAFRIKNKGVVGTRTVVATADLDWVRDIVFKKSRHVFSRNLLLQQRLCGNEGNRSLETGNMIHFTLEIPSIRVIDRT